MQLELHDFCAATPSWHLHAVQICPGESIASKINNWAKSYAGNARLEVRIAPPS